MNSESKQKLSNFVMNGVLTFGVTLLIVVGVLVAGTQRDALGPFLLVITIVMAALGVALFGLKYLEHSGYRFLGDELLIGRPFGPLHIAYEAVFRVERIARSNGEKTEKVRIIYNYLGQNKILTITPECPSRLISQLLSNCPNLTSSSVRKVKRNQSFRITAQN